MPGEENQTTGSFHQRGAATRVLAISMLIMGACGLCYQYTLGALGNNLVGSSTEQIFVIIGLMMFAMGLASQWQQHLRGPLIDWFILVEIILGLFGGLSALLIYAAFALTSSYAVVLYGSALLIGGLIGLEIPLLIRINKDYATSLPTNLGQILSMDYIGSLAGALVFTYVLLTRLSLPRIGMALGVANVGVAMVGLWYFWEFVRYRRLLFSFGFLSLTALGIAFIMSPATIGLLEQRTFEDPIIYRNTTKYQHIVLTQFRDRVRLYLNGRLQLNSEDEYIYHELLVHPAMQAHEDARRVLVLGGGDGIAVREVLKYPSVEAVTLVDIDPAMIELARRHPSMVAMNEGALADARVKAQVIPEDSRTTDQNRSLSIRRQLLSDQERYLETDGIELAEVQVLTLDADRFLQDVAGTFDVMILDFPDPHGIETSKLYSVEFYRNLRQRLAPGAIIAVQSTSPWFARDVFLCIGETLRAAGFTALPYRQHVPSFGEWGWHLAWADSRQPEAVLEPLYALQKSLVPVRYATPEVLLSAFVFPPHWLDATGIEPNSKLQPVMLNYARKAWRGDVPRVPTAE